MKAYVIEQAGGPQVLKLTDIASREPTSDEVQIQVRAFGLNRIETYLRAGKMGEIVTPTVPGIEAVGEVIHDPAGVFRPGQRVATAMGGMQFERNGSYAEQVTVLRSNVISMEGIALSWEELATLPEAYVTAWGVLDKSLDIQRGQTLLIRGATASVGLAAIAYAKAQGLTVIATTRTADNCSRLREMGADEVVIDDGDIARRVRDIAPEGVDAALEVVGVATLRDTIKTLRPLAGVSVIGLLSGPPVLDQFHLMRDLPAGIRLNFFQSSLFGTPAMPSQNSPLPRLARDVAAGLIPSIHSQTFTFDQLPEAHRVMESDRALGKLVVLL